MRSGVGEALLGRWVAVERARTDPPEALDADEQAELARLRAENAELRMDREFLKSSGLLRHRESEPVELYQLMDAQKATPDNINGFEIARMDRLLEVSRSG